MCLDWIGSIIIVGGTICFLFGLETGASGNQGWNSATVIAYDYFLPLYFQVVLRFEPIISGVSLFALVITLSLATMSTGLFVARTGNFLLPTRAAAVVMTIGTGLFISFGEETSWAKIIIFLIVAGLGAGPLFQAPMIALQSHVRPVDISAAMSAFTFMRSLFSSASIVVGSVVLQRSLPGDGLTLGHDQGEPGETASDEDTGQYVAALRTMWIVYTSICGLLLVATFFIRKADGKSGQTNLESETEGN
jgi:hypothetical protein